MLKKAMVEANVQAKKGIKNGAFKSDEYINVAQGMNRICAAPRSKRLRSVILWEKDSPQDKQPEWKKVVRRWSIHVTHRLMVL